MPTKKKDDPIRVLRIKKGDTLKQIYAKVRRSFSAVDLQRYTQDDEMIPVDDLIAELEVIDAEGKRKTNRKKSK